MKHTMTAPAQGVSRAVLALALAGSCAFAAAEATTETPAEDAVLAPVTVSAHGVSVPYDRTGVSVTVLDIEALQKAGTTTLSDALATVPGVFVLPGGGSNQHGNVSNIAIRGISGNTATLTMMDGMRLFETTGGMNSTPNVIGRTTLFGLGNAEVLRGAQGAIYGGGAMGGVIWMETPEGTADKPALTLFNEYGSFDSYTGNVTAQGRQGKLAYYVSGTYEHTNNDLRHADGSSPAVKHAGRYTNAAEAVRLDYHANEDNTLTFTYRREDATYHRAFPYFLYSWTYPYDVIGQDTAAPTYDFRSQLVTLKGQSRLNKYLTTSLLVGYYGSDSDFGYDASAGNEVRFNLRNVQADWRNVITWNERHSTTAGIGWTRSDYASRTTSYGTTYSSADDTLENIYAFYAEHRYSPVKNWDNTLAVRLDESTTFNTLTTARAASTYRFNRERTRVFASAGRGYRAPGSFQRTAGTRNTAWGLYQGNPNLRCETSRSADMGIEQAVGENHSVTATLFVARTDKAIYTDFNTYPYPYTFANSTGHWTSQGIELTLQGTWEKAWNTGYTVAYTYTQPKRQDNYKDKAIPYSTRQMWNADIHTSPLPGLTTGLGLTAAAQRMDYGLNRVDNFCTLRWYARYEVNEHLSLHLRVENLTDEKFVSEFSSYDPAWSVLNPGVGVYGGCTLTF